MASTTALGHISMMHDAVLANLPPDDLRAIVRALITQGIGTSTVAQRFAQLVRERCSVAKAGETTIEAQRRAKLLFSAADPISALELLAHRVIPDRADLLPQDRIRLNHDVVQAIQSAKETPIANQEQEKRAASALTDFRAALEKARQEEGDNFELERAHSAAYAWSPAYCPAPALSNGLSASSQAKLQVGKTRFETFKLGSVEVPRVFCGLWQLSSPSWGTASPAQIREGLESTVQKGFTAFDMADHYGDTEVITGKFRAMLAESDSIYVATKWCIFKPFKVNSDNVRAALQERKTRLASLPDLVQFHWQHWKDQQYVQALQHMYELQQEGLIGAVGLCNFDTPKTEEVCSALPAGSIVSNQVQFSLVDSRPLYGMCDVCVKHNVKLLTYGSICGGFLADKWLGKPEPDVYSAGFTPSLRKYYDMIGFWGGWTLFQELLQTLSAIGKRHSVSIANVATRWVLQQPAVGAVIIGARLGVSNNADDNARVFDFKLDERDMEEIQAVIKRSNASRMIKEIGDCGDEYR